LIKPPSHITNGFEIVPAVLERHEVAAVAVSLEEDGLERSRAGARHLMRHPTIQQNTMRSKSPMWLVPTTAFSLSHAWSERR
jgi:hypothetical protein